MKNWAQKIFRNFIENKTKPSTGRPDAIHRATIRLTDIANLLDKDWEKLALELNVTPNEIGQIKEEHPEKVAQQATTMFKVWQANGNKATGEFCYKFMLIYYDFKVADFSILLHLLFLLHYYKI